MRALLWALALAFGSPALAQETVPAKKPAERKQVAKKPQSVVDKPKAHSKPTPEQIRRFNELEKKQKSQ